MLSEPVTQNPPSFSDVCHIAASREQCIDDVPGDTGEAPPDLEGGLREIHRGSLPNKWASFTRTLARDGAQGTTTVRTQAAADQQIPQVLVPSEGDQGRIRKHLASGGIREKNREMAVNDRGHSEVVRVEGERKDRTLRGRLGRRGESIQARDRTNTL